MVSRKEEREERKRRIDAINYVFGQESLYALSSSGLRLIETNAGLIELIDSQTIKTAHSEPPENPSNFVTVMKKRKYSECISYWNNCYVPKELSRKDLKKIARYLYDKGNKHS